MTFCARHGDPHTAGGTCLTCFDEQTERVERESLALRLANTTESLRRRAVELAAERNGSG